MKKARQEEAEKYLRGVLRAADDQGVPLVLFGAYADAIERYGLEEWHGDDRPTVGETSERARTCYQWVIESMAAYVLEGGRDRWDAFTQAVFDYIDAGVPGVLNARDALYDSASGFSEFTDPAFAGLVERDDQ